MEQAIKRASGGTWSDGGAYRLAVEQSVFDAKASLLTLGARHYWVRHDRLDPEAISTISSSVWDRHEEGVCHVEFPDPMWHLALHPENAALNSKYAYYLPVAR